MNSGDSRTRLLKRNIAGSLVIKVWSCAVQFLLVPVTLGCLNQYEYGIWLTINSLLVWIDQFDVGLGNGLRNRLAESLARNDRDRARRQVSTTFGMLILVMLPLLGIGLLLLGVTDCYSWLNVDATAVPHLRGLLMMCLALVCSTFVFKFIGNVYLGLQLPAVNNLIIVSGQTVALAAIGVMVWLHVHSLTAVAVAYTLSPLAVYLLSYPVTFTRYHYLRPSFRLFSREELRGLFGLGLKFFFVQIAGLVLFATSNVIISNLFSPADVTPYQVSNRYFWLLMMIFTVISAPLWSATTDAYTRGDWDWIRRMMRRMRQIMAIFAMVLVVMFLAAPYVYKMWVGTEVVIPTELSLLMAVYVAVLIYSTCYSNVLFGIGKIRLITIVTVLEAIVYIPLAIFMGRQFGVVGIIAALTLVNVACAVANRLQFTKLSNGHDSGIWGK